MGRDTLNRLIARWQPRMLSCVRQPRVAVGERVDLSAKSVVARLADEFNNYIGFSECLAKNMLIRFGSIVLTKDTDHVCALQFVGVPLSRRTSLKNLSS